MKTGVGERRGWGERRGKGGKGGKSGTDLADSTSTLPKDNLFSASFITKWEMVCAGD